MLYDLETLTYDVKQALAAHGVLAHDVAVEVSYYGSFRASVCAYLKSWRNNDRIPYDAYHSNVKSSEWGAGTFNESEEDIVNHILAAKKDRD